MNRQSQSQNVKNTNNDPQNATQKTMDLTTRTPQKTMSINLESEKLGIKRRVEIS